MVHQTQTKFLKKQKNRERTKNGQNSSMGALHACLHGRFNVD